MRISPCCGGRASRVGGVCILLAVAAAFVIAATHEVDASPPWLFGRHRHGGDRVPCADGVAWEGTWYWMRSPDQEKRVIAGYYNRYCIRCHGVDGRGVWDIPDVPDFTNVRWQASRTDGQLARIILEGRGAVMPPFRGTLTLEESWAMARYLRTLVPGSEASRPDFGQQTQPAGKTLPSPQVAPSAAK